MGAYNKTKLSCMGSSCEIMGELYLPESDVMSLPLVILCHGFNSAGADLADIAEHLAETGILSYTFDFPGGSLRSNGSTLDMSIEAQQADLRRVIDMVSQLDKADNGRIYLYGESQGGFVSALTAAEMPDRIAGLFLVYPAFCIPDDWCGKDPAELEGPFEFMGLEISSKFYDSVPRYDVFEHVKSFDGPVKIWHGDCDTVVDISYSRRLEKALPDASLTVVGGCGHGFPPLERERIAAEICDRIADDI